MMIAYCIENCEFKTIKENKKASKSKFIKGIQYQVDYDKTLIKGETYVKIQTTLFGDFTETELINVKDLKRYFSRCAEETIQCKNFVHIEKLNSFLASIDPDKIFSCGYSEGSWWVYYKKFMTKNWDE